MLESIDVTSKKEVELKDFNWDEIETEQLKIKQRKNLNRIKPEQLGYTSDQIAMYEESFSRLQDEPMKGSIIKGTVLSVNGKTAIVDIDYREDGFIDLSKESNEYIQYIVPGNRIDIKVLNTREEKDFIGLSYTDAVYFVKEQEILDSIGKKVAYKGKIKELVSGGYLVLIDEIKTFMPGSLAGVNKLHNFEVMLGLEVYVVPVNYERGNIVVSHRDYLHTLIPGKIESLKENSDKLMTGFVTGTTQYGVFCEFNECLTGMILANDLDETSKHLFENRSIKPGQAINFYVKEIINSKKIILTQILRKDPWKDITDRYKIPCTVKGKVTAIKEYGAFIEIEDDVTGLLHSSEYEKINIKEGDIIDVKITRIDTSSKKIFLNI